MAPKQISKPLGVLEAIFNSLRNLGYTGVALASVLGMLVLLGQMSRTVPDKPLPTAVKKHR